MKIALLYPPFMDARAPQLALPSLAAFLRASSVTVSMLDLAIDGILWLTERQSLESCRQSLFSQRDQSKAARRLLEPLDRAMELAPWAVGALRDPEVFFDSREFNAARNVLSCIVEAHAAARNDRLRCSLEPIIYNVEGVNSGSLKDLIEVTSQPQANLFHEFYLERVVSKLKAELPDAVGISITNHQQWLLGLALARMMKSAGMFVVLGGALISKFPDELRGLPEFFSTFADGVIPYEGETAILELLIQLNGQRRFEKVPNLLFFDGRYVRANSTRVEDVNALPTPDFEGLPLDRYLAPDPVLPILTGKGCYFNRCKFCEIPFINHISPKAYRVRNPELVVNDVRTLAARHGARHFVITDEALSPKLLLNLAEGFAPYASEERHFTGYARLEDGFTPDVFETIAAMGVRKLYFGMESASQAMIDHMDKGTDAAGTARILQDCGNAGIRFHLFSIIGFPEETEPMARETCRFLLDHRSTIEVPGNSFGVQRFSLDPRAAYFREKDHYGIRMTGNEWNTDFLLGFGPEQWENSRGLTVPDIDRLLDEFNSNLVDVYRRLYGYRHQVFPSFEEYAVLYCSRYAVRDDFPYRASLPESSNIRFSIRVNPAVQRSETEDVVWLITPVERFALPGETLRRIVTAKPRTTSDLAIFFPANVVAGIDECLRSGVLQLLAEKSVPVSTARMSL